MATEVPAGWPQYSGFQLAGSGSGPIVTFFEDVLVPTMKQAAGLLETFLGDLVKVVQGVKAGTMTVADGQALLKFYDQGMEGYTYLE